VKAIRITAAVVFAALGVVTLTGSGMRLLDFAGPRST
jgi:hypothetical protein